MWQNFLASRFAKMTPLMTEQPFTLYLGEGLSVAGRIDAIFEREDGVWEIVDYKTGASEPDPLQLAIYAQAVEEIWAKPTSSALWLLLRDGREQPAASVDVAALDGIAAGIVICRRRLLDEVLRRSDAPWVASTEPNRRPDRRTDDGEAVASRAPDHGCACMAP